MWHATNITHWLIKINVISNVLILSMEIVKLIGLNIFDFNYE